jgi:hypothetical protein
VLDHDLTVNLDQTIDVDLTDDEQYVLRCGLREWGGPARPTDKLAAAMGFQNVSHLFREGRQLANALENGEPLTASDWQRVLVATEIVFVSDVYGSGQDWAITTGLPDETTIRLLRSLQRKIAAAIRHTRS